MGNYASYSGPGQIPVDRRKLFTEQMMKILNYGGMMCLETVSLYGHKLYLLKPLSVQPEGHVAFNYNYFEDDFWETARYDAKEARLSTEKIGSREFCSVILAAYTLYECYDPNPGVVLINWEVPGTKLYVGWINHILGTSFSHKTRFRIWDIAEQIAFLRLGDYSPPLSFPEMMDIVPKSLLYYVGGTEFTDLCYITHGTETLTEDQVEPGSYAADILECKNRLADYFNCRLEKETLPEMKEGPCHEETGCQSNGMRHHCEGQSTEHIPLNGEDGTEDSSAKENRDGNGIDQIWALVTKDRKEREATTDRKLGEIAACSLFLPARVIVYLASELKGQDFWENWKTLYQSVYHDEAMKTYAPLSLFNMRKAAAEMPAAGVRTSDFLKMNDFLLFYDTPKELKDKPRYCVSDDDRLYWWDGTDNVILSDEMDNWLSELAKRHRSLMQEQEGKRDNQDADADLKSFMKVLSDTDEFYHRIFPFQDMFYDFVRNSNRDEYRAAVELIRELAEENRDEGSAIKYSKVYWGICSRKVTFNPGRIRMKRLMSVLANEKLREKDFGF